MTNRQFAVRATAVGVTLCLLVGALNKAGAAWDVSGERHRLRWNLADLRVAVNGLDSLDAERAKGKAVHNALVRAAQDRSDWRLLLHDVARVVHPRRKDGLWIRSVDIKRTPTGDDVLTLATAYATQGEDAVAEFVTALRSMPRLGDEPTSIECSRPILDTIGTGELEVRAWTCDVTCTISRQPPAGAR